MVVEIKGQQLRIRLKSPKRFSRFRTHDVGRKGGLQRIAAYSRKMGWMTQAWRLNLKDFTEKTAISTVKRLRITKKKKAKGIRLIKKYYK